jgi:hypothetical protein
MSNDDFNKPPVGDDFTKPPVDNAMNPYSQSPAMGVGGGVAPRTSNLAIWSMVLGILSLFCSILTGIIGFILGVVALIKIGGSEGKLKGSGFAITGIVCSLLFSVIGVGMMLPAVQQVRVAARRTQSMNNLRELGLGTLNYESAYRSFPAISGNGNGEGTELSWRVHILPFLEQQHLYEQFHLDEPWDSPHNKSLLGQMPAVYESPIVGPLGEGLTVYQRPVGNGAFDDGDGSTVTFNDITDGSSNTILMVETNSSEAVPWTKPDDYGFDPSNPVQGLGENYLGQQFLGVLCDCSTHMFDGGPGNTQNVKALFTKDAGDAVNFGY